MCRLLAYLGPPRDLHGLLVAPRGLLDQSWRPRCQQHGTVNADGWGVGWYTGSSAEPARYRSVLPMWADSHVRSLLPHTQSGLTLAAVRGATPPSPTQLTNTPPFESGRWLLVHNGLIAGFHDGVGEELRRTLSLGAASALEGGTDSELLLALLLERLARGAAVPAALADVCATVRELTPARLNLLLSDGVTLWGLRSGDSLWVRDATGTGEGVTLGSEPDDDAGWTEIPDDTVAHVTHLGVELASLDAAQGAA